ncbi:MAG: TauD/TfdA family dioxygenase [Sphingomonadales bacterium]|nr:MAG: TauD/TfdA family dioxygenase [Sphingomonadales bacterium]
MATPCCPISNGLALILCQYADIRLPRREKPMTSTAASCPARFETRPLAPFGIELVGELSAPLSAEEVAFLRAIVEDHAVLVARGQRLTIERHREIMALFGPVPERELYIVELSDGVLGADPLTFHSDMAFCHTPYRYGSLHALEIEGGRTSTAFANGTRAYKRLTPGQCKLLARLTTLAVSTCRTGQAFREDIPEDAFRTQRAAVIFHPRTFEPILYVAEAQHARFNELDRAASDALFEALFPVLYAPDNVYEHVWSVGDFVLYDNLTLQHARPDPSSLKVRKLQRMGVADVSADDMLAEFLDQSGLPEVTEVA